MLFRPRTVCIHGTKYRIGAIIHLGSVADLPEFASIDKIVVFQSNKTYFVLKTLVTVEFSQDFHAFEVLKPKT